MFVGWFPAPQKYWAKRGAPGFVFDLDEDFYYGFPSIDEKSIKVGGHRRFEALARPEEKDLFPPASERLEALGRFVRDCLPLASDQLLRSSTCIYAMTPNEDFIIDRRPERSGLGFAAGFSGHGFTFASVVGEILADLAIDGKTDHPIDFLAASRFWARES